MSGFTVAPCSGLAAIAPTTYTVDGHCGSITIKEET